MLPLEVDCAIVVAKQEDFHSNAPADKRVSEQRYFQPSRVY